MKIILFIMLLSISLFAQPIWWASVDEEENSDSVFTTVYTSDFSAGTDGWTSINMAGANGNIDGIADSNDTYRAYADNVDNNHYVYRTPQTIDNVYKIWLDYYLPSANTNVDGFEVWNGGLSGAEVANETTTDTWTRIYITYTAVNGVWFVVAQTKADATSFIGADLITDDLIYLKNIIIQEYVP